MDESNIMIDPRKEKLKGNQNASKGGVSGKGRVVIDLADLKPRVVAEAKRRGCTLKEVVVDSLKQTLP